jgi:hypothetical protein
MPLGSIFRRHMTGEYLEAFGDVVELPIAARNAGRGARDAATGVAQKTLDRTHVSGASK